jgi:hypothetical protein
MPGVVGDFDQKSAHSEAAKWASGLGLGDAADSCLILEKPLRLSRIYAVVYFLRVRESGLSDAGLTETKLADLSCGDTVQVATEALSLVERHAKVCGWRDNESGWRSGRFEGDAAHQVDEESPSWQQRQEFDSWMALHQRSKEELKARLERDGSKSMLDWKAKLTEEPLDAVPDSLRKKPCLDGWSGLVIPDPHAADVTEWQHLPSKLELQKRPAPQGWLSAVRMLMRWCGCSLLR